MLGTIRGPHCGSGFFYSSFIVSRNASIFTVSQNAPSCTNPSTTGEEGKDADAHVEAIPYLTSLLDFSLLQVLACVVLVCFSDYLHLLINIRHSFTTVTDRRALMLWCVSSRFFNWAGRNSTYLANGRQISGPRTLFKENAIPVKELLLLGIIGDQDESEKSNATILRSTVQSKLFVIARVDESTVTACLYTPDDHNQSLPEDRRGHAIIKETDMIK